jgi:hypothetical protein
VGKCLGYFCPGAFFVCPDLAFPFLPSKRRYGSTGLAPRKALKTAPASAAGAALGLGGRLASAQGAPEQGVQAAQVVVGRAPEADPSIEAAVESRETAGAAAALSPPVVLPVLAPASRDGQTGRPARPEPGPVKSGRKLGRAC